MMQISNLKLQSVNVTSRKWHSLLGQPKIGTILSQQDKELIILLHRRLLLPHHTCNPCTKPKKENQLAASIKQVKLHGGVLFEYHRAVVPIYWAVRPVRSLSTF